MTAESQWVKDRNDELLTFARRGLTQKQLCVLFRLSPPRVSGILKAAGFKAERTPAAISPTTRPQRTGSARGINRGRPADPVPAPPAPVVPPPPPAEPERKTYERRPPRPEVVTPGVADEDGYLQRGLRLPRRKPLQIDGAAWLAGEPTTLPALRELLPLAEAHDLARKKTAAAAKWARWRKSGGMRSSWR